MHYLQFAHAHESEDECEPSANLASKDGINAAGMDLLFLVELHLDLFAAALEGQQALLGHAQSQAIRHCLEVGPKDAQGLQA